MTVGGVAVRDLTVDVRGMGKIVEGISFAVSPGEVLGVVGESGCGKTTAALALLGGTKAGAHITAGDINIDGRPMLGLGDDQLRERRGRDVAYVSQDPTAALNPSLRIGRQLREMLEVHEPDLGKAETEKRIQAILDDVRLPSDNRFLSRYPHELSGGQQQRVAIAMAAILRPAAIVMDEPTTGLDVTTQAHILRTVRELCSAHQVAIVYVSHDLAVIGKIADRVLVIYAGRVVETGPTNMLERPAHPYTRGLVGAIPSMSQARRLTTIPGHPPAVGRAPHGCRFADRCPYRIDACVQEEPNLVDVDLGHAVRCIRVQEVAGLPLDLNEPKGAKVLDYAAAPLLEVKDLRASYGSNEVLRGVSFEVAAHECVALVGESGSGKSTLGRSIIGLKSGWQGSVVYRGEELSHAVRSRNRQARQGVQYIFQSPYNSLNPRRTIGESIAAPMSEFLSLGRSERDERVMAALDQVSLSSHLASRYPDQLSGGERQRAAIARALVCDPEVLICDEVTSALDVSVQAAIVDLLAELQAQRGVALLFITHNLALVRSIADRVIVLNHGEIVESGLTGSVLDSPSDSYTRSLVADTPALDVGSQVITKLH